MGHGVMAKRTKQPIPNKAQKQMSIEDIVRTDWERNYKGSGISLNVARLAVKSHVDKKLPIYRVGNTLILLIPRGNIDLVKFHTITADPVKTFFGLLLQFFISLSMNDGTEVAYTTISNDNIYNMVKKMFGDYVTLEPNNEEPEKGKYLLTIQIGPFVRDMKSQQTKGVTNELG